MKKSKKILLVASLIIFILSLFSFNYEVQAYTPNELREKLDYIRNSSNIINRSTGTFVENGETYYGTFIEDYGTYLGETCHGYANAVSLALYNSNQNTAFNDWVFTENVEELCIGDLIRYNSGYSNHTMVVIDIVGDTVYITDANFNNKNGVRWGRAYSKSELTEMISRTLAWEEHNWTKGYFRHYIYNDVKTVSDNENPVITSAYVDPTSMTGSSYTVKVSATDNVGIAKVPIMTWAVDNGQDDIKEYRATSEGSEYSYTVEASNHGNNTGLYSSHVYVYDEANNGASVGLNEIPMGSKFVKDLGNFEARIVLKSNPNYVITTSGNENNDNVILGEKSVSDESQIWKFNQKSDGSYEIVNIASDKALDITDASDQDGANVAIYTKNDSSAQTFYIMEYNGGYRIVPKCTINLKAINLEDTNPSDGGRISLYHAGNADAQTWTFEEGVLESIELNKTSLTLTGIGTTEQLTATVTPNDVTVTWESSNTNVAEVSSSGVVTSVGLGTATITATTADGNCSAECEVLVNCDHKNTTLHEAVKSTCLVQGNEEYITCDDCGKVISGSDKKLPLAEHNYGDLIEKVEPTTPTSTSIADGMEAHYECSVCEKLFNENREEVTEEELIIKAPLHTYEDWIADTNSHWKESGCGNIIEQEAHKGGEATCISKAICEVCNLEYGEINNTNHKNIEIRNAVEATTEKEGYTGDIYCTDCGELVTKGEVIPVIIVNPEEPVEEETEPVNPEEPAEEETVPVEEETKSEDLEKPAEEEIIDNEEEKTSENTEKNESSMQPKTDDNSNMMLWISLLVVSSISFIIISRCNTKRKVSKHSK